MNLTAKSEREKKYPMFLGGKQRYLTERQISHIIKHKMKNDIAVIKTFRKFELSLDQLDRLEIQIRPLDDRFAQTDDKAMVISESLFKSENNEDWLDGHYFIFVHEILHFILRTYEKIAGYFGDHEEIEAFELSVASLLGENKSLDEVWNKIFPKINFHFHDAEKARRFFLKLLVKGRDILNS